ncbi:MAG: hypothetical protein RIE86_00500 [Imperialibacter sp.]|uniref:hypothetical protein n=1 Tax=Imperialibacter sp. TaxID=2038411 RepID=UPI0032ECC472
MGIERKHLAPHRNGLRKEEMMALDYSGTKIGPNESGEERTFFSAFFLSGKQLYLLYFFTLPIRTYFRLIR